MLAEHARRAYYRLRLFCDLPAMLELLRFRDLRKQYYDGLWRAAVRNIGAVHSPWESGFGRIARGGLTAVVRQHEVMLDSHLTLELMGNKALTYGLLTERRCPIPSYLRFSIQALGEAERFRQRLNGPAVVKPNSGTGGGNGVTTGIMSAADLRRAARLASGYDTDLLIEEQREGHSYRLLYLDGELIDAVRRDAPFVVGDGKSSIRQLIRAETIARLADKPARALSPLRIDQDCRNTLALAGLRPSSIPEAGRRVVVKRAVNQNAAPQNHNVLGTVHPRTVALGSRLMAELGVRFGGLDIISPDISEPLEENGGVIGEINTTPGIHHHYLIADPRRITPVAEILLDRLFATRSGVLAWSEPARRAPVIETCDAA